MPTPYIAKVLHGAYALKTEKEAVKGSLIPEAWQQFVLSMLQTQHCKVHAHTHTMIKENFKFISWIQYEINHLTIMRMVTAML